MFPSSTKRKIRHFHVAVVHRQQRNDKKRDHVQSCCFANINLLLCLRSLCRRYCHCLSSLLTARGGGVVGGGGECLVDGPWVMASAPSLQTRTRQILRKILSSSPSTSSSSSFSSPSLIIITIIIVIVIIRHILNHLKISLIGTQSITNAHDAVLL